MWHGEHKVTYAVGADNAEDYMAKKLERLRKEFGPQVTLESTLERSIENPQVEVAWTHDASLWPRFGAKLGLGFGREVLGEDWLDSEVARYLQGVLYDGGATVPAPYAPLAPISEQLAGTYFVPPDHVVTVMSTDHGAALSLFLFGDQRYLVPLGGEVGDDVPATWIFDARGGKSERLSWTDYAERTVLRLFEGHQPPDRG